MRRRGPEVLDPVRTDENAGRKPKVVLPKLHIEVLYTVILHGANTRRVWKVLMVQESTHDLLLDLNVRILWCADS